MPYYALSTIRHGEGRDEKTGYPKMVVVEEGDEVKGLPTSVVEELLAAGVIERKGAKEHEAEVADAEGKAGVTTEPGGGVKNVNPQPTAVTPDPSKVTNTGPSSEKHPGTTPVAKSDK